MNIGYNLRPMEIQAAFGLEQLARLDEMNANRRRNVVSFQEAVRGNRRWRNQIRFPSSPDGLDPCWFGIPMILQCSRKPGAPQWQE